jgi:hypothetical protein
MGAHQSRSSYPPTRRVPRSSRRRSGTAAGATGHPAAILRSGVFLSRSTRGCASRWSRSRGLDRVAVTRGPCGAESIVRMASFLADATRRDATPRLGLCFARLPSPCARQWRGAISTSLCAGSGLGVDGRVAWIRKARISRTRLGVHVASVRHATMPTTSAGKPLTRAPCAPVA